MNDFQALLLEAADLLHPDFAYVKNQLRKAAEVEPVGEVDPDDAGYPFVAMYPGVFPPKGTKVYLHPVFACEKDQSRKAAKDMEPVAWRCERTGNPCGTDTHAEGHVCPCPTCQRVLTTPPAPAVSVSDGWKTINGNITADSARVWYTISTHDIKQIYELENQIADLQNQLAELRRENEVMANSYRELIDPSNVQVRFETTSELFVGVIYREPKAVEWEDDGSMTVVVEAWPS